MKKVKLFESFLSEANRGKVHKAAKQGSYPAVIVVVLDGKVIHQEPVSTPEVAPATFNVMQEKYPKALLHLEDKTGKRLFSESVVNEDSAGRMELLKTGKYKDTRGKKHTLKAGQIGRHERIGWDGDFIHFGNLVFDANAFGNDDIEVYESLVIEKREDVGKYNTVKKVISKLGRRPSEKDLAKFINDNYYDVTEVERGDDDSKADDKIADLVGVYKFDIDDWETAWNGVQNESVVSEGKMPDKLTNDDDIVFLKTSENSKGAHYNVYYKGYDIDFGGVGFGTEKQLKSYAKEYILSRQWANKLRWEDAKPLPESVVNEEVVDTCWDGYKLGDPKTKISSKTGKRVNNCVPANESVVTEASKSNLKKGDKLKFTETGEIIFIIEPKGDGYDFKMASDPREKDHAPKGWFDMMIKRGKLVSESVVNEAAYENSTQNELAEYIISLSNELKYAKANKDKKEIKFLEGDIAEVKAALAKMKNESVVTEGIFDSIADPIKALHFETDPKTAELMKMELGKKQGETNKKKQIDSAEYSLRRFRKSIKFGDGTYLGVFLPGSYDASVSTLGDGPHKKAVAKVKWSQKKYDQWLEDMAANGGADNAFDMAQNAKNETGLIDWVKKEFRGDDPLQRIQWDIEAFAESVTNEEIKSYNEKDTLYKQIHDKYAESIKGLKAGKIKKLTDLVSVQRWAMEDEHDTPGHDHKKMSATFKEERKLFKQWMAGDKDVQLKEAVELAHVYDEAGEMFGTGELVKTKGKKSLIRWDGSREEWIDSKLVKLVESFKKFKDHIASINDGAGSTADIYFTKGKGYYAVVEGESDYDFDAKDKQELIEKLKDNKFTNEPFEGSI